jgi:hypothetical protein
MILRRILRTTLAAAAILAVAAIGGLGWFNWWIRHTWMPSHPVCWDGEALVQFTEPLTPEAHALFLQHISWTRAIDSERHRAQRAAYVRVIGSQAYVRTWYWVLGPTAMMNVQAYFENDLEKLFNSEEIGTCLGLARIATIRRSDSYATEPYISESTSELLAPLAFGVEREREGQYSLVGRFFQHFEDIPPKPPSGKRD